MKYNPQPGPADPREETDFFVRVALEGDQPPPAEFVSQVLSGQILLRPDTMNRLVDRGWVSRQRCEIWSRVMGYLRPVSHWNAGKKSEFAERVVLDPKKICD
jgi:hypothetical protein